MSISKSMKMSYSYFYYVCITFNKKLYKIRNIIEIHNICSVLYLINCFKCKIQFSLFNNKILNSQVGNYIFW